MVRNIKELLQLTLDNIYKLDSGLCCLSHRLYYVELINKDERDNLIYYIENNRPSKYSSLNAFINRNENYYWTIGDKKHRIKWLKKHIKLNSN